VIVNYHGGQYLFRCLEYLRQQTYGAFEVLIVDSGRLTARI
jgi:glycosyltransferase involved in cell wall biosynthesis